MDVEVEFGTRITGEPGPVAVRFGRRRLLVVAVLDRWYGRQDVWWKLDTEDGPCILRQVAAGRAWVLAAVPNDGRPRASATVVLPAVRRRQ